MKSPGEVVTDLVNAKLIEEVPEDAVSDRSHVIADQMLVSLAISVKRIADAIDGTALGVDIQESLAGLCHAYIYGSNG